MRMDQIIRVSGQVLTDDLDWEEAARAGLSQDEAFALSYFADIEDQTIFYLRDLLASGLADDPDVLSFVTIWSYEEYFHGRALARLLSACGRPPKEGRARGVRRAARLAERLQGLGARLGGRLFHDAFPALYLAWGASQELTTLRGYEALAASTRNPVLAELCRRIARQERRHFAWYFHSARERLSASAAARRIARFVLRRFWAPVGVAVKGPADALRLLEFLFPGEAGRVLAADVDGRIGALPGLAGLGLLGRFVARADRRAARSRAATPDAGVVRAIPSLDAGTP